MVFGMWFLSVFGLQVRSVRDLYLYLCTWLRHKSWKCSQIFAHIYVAFVLSVCLLNDYAQLISTRDRIELPLIFQRSTELGI